MSEAPTSADATPEVSPAHAQLLWVEDGKDRPFSPAEGQATSWLDELENMPAEKIELAAKRAARKAEQVAQARTDDGLTWV